MLETGKAIGVVAEDPASSLSVGSQLFFQSVLQTYTPPSTATAVQDWASLDGILLAVTFSDLAFNRIEGSAIVVAPGIALCAAHVIEPHLEAMVEGHEAATCFGIIASGLQIWRVRKVTIVPHSDLAILGLELASALQSGTTLFQSAITTRMPKLGERVTIFGFRASEEAFERVAPDAPVFGASLLVCAGEVIDRHLTRRDSVMLPFPVLAVACPTWGGMSGGPVSDCSGRVLGLLSSSVTGDQSEGPSYVSLLLPALSAPFEGGWPAPLFAKSGSLIALDHQSCSIDKRDAISRVLDETSGGTAVRYGIWE